MQKGWHFDQYVHACKRPLPGPVRPESLRNRTREGILHKHNDPGSVHHDGLSAE